MEHSLLIKEKLEQAHRIAIFGHQAIDGDALGAMYWLGKQLEKLWKQIFYFTPDVPSPLFDFLDLSRLQYDFDYTDYDELVLVDMNHPIRMKKFYEGHESYFDEKEKIIIDHHLPEKNRPLDNAFIYRDDTAISACELIFELTNSWWNLIDEEIATLLYMGIVTDSGNFRHDEKHQTLRLMENAVWLIKKGADKQSIIQHIFRSKSFEDLQFMQKILGRVKKAGDIVYSRYSNEELLEAWLHPDSADYALYLMVDIKEWQLIILGKEQETATIKISLRGKWKYSCRDIASHFGWGGHFNASGCTIPFSGNLEQDMYDFVEKVKGLL